MEDGWYLMSTAHLESVLAQWRDGIEPDLPPGAERLSNPEALARRNAGNIPDADDRSLRLVLHVSDDDVARIADARLAYEPDFHEAPRWRKQGSRPVNVVPLRAPRGNEVSSGPWWDEPELHALEQEWRRSGTIAGMQVPGEYRSFVFKTVLALQRAGQEVTPDSVADSVARWLPREAETLRRALKEKEPGV